MSTMEKITNMELWRFSVITPTLVTSEGSKPCALDTRFCTFTAAISGLVPCLKVISMVALPVLVAEDDI